MEEIVIETLEDLPSAETSSPLAASDSDSPSLAAQSDHVSSSLEPIQLEEDEDAEAQSGFCSGYPELVASQNVEPRAVQGKNGRRHLVIARWQVPKSHRGTPNGFHGGQNPQVSKLGAMPKHGTHRDSRAAPVSGNKVWTRKPKLENHGGNLNSRGQKEAANQSAQNKNCEVLIGSISVTLGNSNGPGQSNSLAGAQDDGVVGHPMPRKSNVLEKSIKPDAVQCGMTRSTIKLWRPVSRGETRGPTSVQSENREPEVDVVTGKGNDVSSESCLRSCASNNNSSGSEKNSPTLMEETPCPGEGFCFSSQAAEAFLAQSKFSFYYMCIYVRAT